MLRGQRQQPLRLGDILLRLHGHAAVEAGVVQQRLQVRRQEVASQRRHGAIDPGVRERRVAPEVLVCVDTHGHNAGTGVPPAALDV